MKHIEATLTRAELAAPFELAGGADIADPLPALTRCALEIEDHPKFGFPDLDVDTLPS